MSEPIYRDPVVAEIHAIREKMLKEWESDPVRYMEELRKRQQASGRKIIPVPRRTPNTTSPESEAESSSR